MPEVGQLEAFMMKGERLKTEYGWLYDELLTIFARYDPIELVCVGAPEDEYAPEVEALLPRLRKAQTEQELHQIVFEIFVAYFDEDLAGSEATYREPTVDVWQAWKRYSA